MGIAEWLAADVEGKDFISRAWEKGREPCPWRVVEDIGGGFGLGVVMSFMWQSVKTGFSVEPNMTRRQSFVHRTVNICPRRGGDFALWCCLYAGFECAITSLRGKDDAFNSILGGAGAGAFATGFKQGWPKMVGGGIFGGLFLACIELGQRLMFSSQASSGLYVKHQRIPSPSLPLMQRLGLQRVKEAYHPTRNEIKQTLRFVPAPPEFVSM